MESQQTQIHQLKLGRPLSNAEIDDYLKGYEPQVIYNLTTDAILRQAELLIESERIHLQK